MTSMAKPWSPSSILLALGGAIVACIGLYFILLRPSLLPEDIRYMGLTTAEVTGTGPRLEAWLAQVFSVLGGYALATGLLTVALAATGFRERRPVAVAGAFLGGAASIGLMTWVNFAIGSDFKWLLLGCALVWASSFIAFGAEATVAGSTTRTPDSPNHKGSNI